MVQKNGNWQTLVQLKNFTNGPHFWQATAVKDGVFSISKKINFELALPEKKRAITNDPIGDDLGPNGNYQYPTDPTFKRQMDLKSARAFTAGNNLRLEVEMVEPLSTVWKPFNGFDHLLLMIFIDVPEKKGISILPNMNMELPSGEEWDVGMMANGWSLSTFGSEGSGRHDLGSPISQKPLLTTLPGRHVIQLQIPASSLGNPDHLKGAKIYIYTWDGSGDESGLRPLRPMAQAYSFGGGTANDPKYMDVVRLGL